MDDRSSTDSDVEIVSEAPAEDVAELDDVELGETEDVADEIAELDDAELVAENDIEFDDAALEDEAAAEEIAELDEIDPSDSQPEPIDEPVLQLDTADSQEFEHGLRRDPTDTPGDGGKAPVLRRDPPADPVPEIPELPPPPPEAKDVFPAVIDNKLPERSVMELEPKPAIVEQPDSYSGIEKGY